MSSIHQSLAAAQVQATQHLGFALQFPIEALRFGEGPALAGRLVPMLPPLLQLQVLAAQHQFCTGVLCKICRCDPQAERPCIGPSATCRLPLAGCGPATCSSQEEPAGIGILGRSIAHW